MLKFLRINSRSEGDVFQPSWTTCSRWPCLSKSWTRSPQGVSSNQRLVGYQVKDEPKCGLCMIVLGQMTSKRGTVHGAVQRYTDIISDQIAFNQGKFNPGFRNRFT